MTLPNVLILALATLYVVHAVVSTEGPFGLFRWLRDHTRKQLKGLFDCPVCTAFWVALMVLAIYYFVPFGTYIVSVPAVAGAALAVRSYTGINHG